MALVSTQYSVSLSQPAQVLELLECAIARFTVSVNTRLDPQPDDATLSLTIRKFIWILSYVTATRF